MNPFKSLIRFLFSSDGRSFLHGEFGSAIESVFKYYTHSGLTGEKKEEMDYSNDLFVQNWDELTGPRAQINDTALGFDDIGLNRMMMAGNQPGATATSPSASGASGADPLGAILGTLMKFKGLSLEQQTIDNDKSLREYANQTKRMEAENYGKYLDIMGNYYGTKTTGEEYKNQAFWTMFGLDYSSKDADIHLKDAQANYFMQVAQSETTRRLLMESGINVNNIQVAIGTIQKAILIAQQKYSDRYFKAVADLSKLQVDMTQIDATNYQTLQDKGLLYNGAVAELASVIFDAGMTLDIWEGDAFKKAVSGTMTKKDWTQTVTSILKTLIAGGAAVGVAGIRAASRGVVPPMINRPPAYEMDPSSIGTTLF